jgi:hypothetical protein
LRAILGAWQTLFYKFFIYVQNQQFDIAADAFTSFKDLLTSHKILIANFLEKNYEPVMERYGELLKSENYVTRRQSLKVRTSGLTLTSAAQRRCAALRACHPCSLHSHPSTVASAAAW